MCPIPDRSLYCYVTSRLKKSPLCPFSICPVFSFILYSPRLLTSLICPFRDLSLSVCQLLFSPTCPIPTMSVPHIVRHSVSSCATNEDTALDMLFGQYYMKLVATHQLSPKTSMTTNALICRDFVLALIPEVRSFIYGAAHCLGTGHRQLATLPAYFIRLIIYGRCVVVCDVILYYNITSIQIK